MKYVDPKSGTTPTITVEFCREEDGRWIAEFPERPGVMTYGDSMRDAAINVVELYLRVSAESAAEVERLYDKALEEGDACPRCLRDADGQRVWGKELTFRHARTCPYRMKHGCPECGTKEGKHPDGCTQDVTDEEQAAHDLWEARCKAAEAPEEK